MYNVLPPMITTLKRVDQQRKYLVEMQHQSIEC